MDARARRRRPGRWTHPAELAFPREHRKRYAEFKRLRIGEDLVLDERTSRLAEKLTAAISELVRPVDGNSVDPCRPAGAHPPINHRRRPIGIGWIEDTRHGGERAHRPGQAIFLPQV